MTSLRFAFALCSLLVAAGAAGGCGGGEEGSAGAPAAPGVPSSPGGASGPGSPVPGNDEDEGAGAATPAAPDVEGFAGEWQTTFGRLRLKATGDRVRGTYEFCDGTLSGTVDGRRLEGTWDEDTSACQDAVSAARPVAEGTFSFKLDARGDAFTGSYETTGSPTPNEWSGTR